MTNLALVTANTLNVVESIEQMTLPAAEAVTAGNPVRIDVSAGKFTKSNATTEAEARFYGTAVKTVAAGEPLTAVRKGVLDGFDLSALAYDANVFLSDTDGALADAAGTITKCIGRVIPATGTTLGTAFDKLLLVDPDNSLVETHFAVTSELLAASVDKWVYVADRACRVVKIEEIHSVVGGSGAQVDVRKVTSAGTAAPGDAAGATVKELLSAAIDLTATINVKQAGALTATAADLVMAAGDKLALNFGGTLTGLVGALTITIQPE